MIKLTQSKLVAVLLFVLLLVSSSYSIGAYLTRNNISQTTADKIASSIAAKKCIQEYRQLGCVTDLTQAFRGKTTEDGRSMYVYSYYYDHTGIRYVVDVSLDLRGGVTELSTRVIE